jgi:hypothetical protein
MLADAGWGDVVQRLLDFDAESSDGTPFRVPSFFARHSLTLRCARMCFVLPGPENNLVAARE